MITSECPRDDAADAAMATEYLCSFCGQMMTDMNAEIQPCPLCDEWRLIIEVPG